MKLSEYEKKLTNLNKKINDSILSFEEETGAFVDGIVIMKEPNSDKTHYTYAKIKSIHLAFDRES